MAKKYKDEKRCQSRTSKVKAKISETEIKTHEKMRVAFFATDPKCKECGAPFDRRSVLMICRKCLEKKYYKRYRERKLDYAKTYRQKNREKLLENSREYYKANKVKIKIRKYHREEEECGQKI